MASSLPPGLAGKFNLHKPLLQRPQVPFVSAKTLDTCKLVRSSAAEVRGGGGWQVVPAQKGIFYVDTLFQARRLSPVASDSPKL